MKRSFLRMKRYLFPLMAMTFVIAAFSSCLKNDDNNTINNQVSGVMAFNLATGKTVDFVIAGRALTNLPLSYGNFTGTYLSAIPGSSVVDTYDHNLTLKLATASAEFGLNKYYSVFFVGKDTAFSNIITEDNLDSLAYTSGKAYVRYINAVADSTLPTVKLTSSGTDIFNSTAAFKTVSEFKPVNAGDVNVSISNESSTINATRTITLEDSKVYTVLLMGKSGGAGTADSVQVKFITNGTIMP